MPPPQERIATLEAELKLLKWLFPTAAGFVLLCITIFFGLTVRNLRDRVNAAIDASGISAAEQRINEIEGLATTDLEAIEDAREAADQYAEGLALDTKAFDASVDKRVALHARKQRLQKSLAHSEAELAKLRELSGFFNTRDRIKKSQKKIAETKAEIEKIAAQGIP